MGSRARERGCAHDPRIGLGEGRIHARQPSRRGPRSARTRMAGRESARRGARYWGPSRDTPIGLREFQEPDLAGGRGAANLASADAARRGHGRFQADSCRRARQANIVHPIQRKAGSPGLPFGGCRAAPGRPRPEPRAARGEEPRVRRGAQQPRRPSTRRCSASGVSSGLSRSVGPMEGGRSRRAVPTGDMVDACFSRRIGERGDGREVDGARSEARAQHPVGERWCPFIGGITVHQPRGD